MKKLFWFIKQSILLDFKFLKASKWDFTKKIKFLILKYVLILKHFFKAFKLGEDFCKFDNKRIYYNTKYGLSDFQSILSRHQNLINIAEIREVHTVVDIGANVGFFSKLCRDLFPAASILSFEPIPVTYKCLRNNFNNDEVTKVFNLAISDYTGESKMSFNEHDSAISQFSNNGEVSVRVETLDDVIKENNIETIDILKIDTEKFEAHVLRGGVNSLKKTRYLFIEITMEDNNNYSISSLMKLLSTADYDFQLVGFRNYDDSSEGRMSIMDALFVNTKAAR